MIFSLPLFRARQLALPFLLLGFAPLQAAELAVGPNGSLAEVAVGPDHVPLDRSLSGFFATDVVKGAPLDFSKGTSKKDGDKTIYDCPPVQGIALHAEFIPKDKYVLVSGYLENADKNDRAIILQYRLGLTGSDAVFSESLTRGEDVALSGTTESEGNAVPVAALTAGGKAVAIALSPLAPAMFGMAGSTQGLAAKFYLGLSPLTKAFPNRAPFSFLVYPTSPSWGFRGAMEKYYSFFPELYEARFAKMGFFLAVAKGQLPVNMDQYAANVIEMQSPFVKQDLQRDADHHVLSVVYTIVGQREIKFLDTLPADYNAAMDVLAHYTPSDPAAHPVTKEFVCSGTDKWLKDEIVSSGVKGPDGKYVLEIRNTPWGKNSVTFKTDPSPYLLPDTKTPTVGKDSLETIDEWIKSYPQIRGAIVDSLGSRWPAVADYSPEHMAATQYPLTFDATGRLFVHNATSHYEWVRAAHEKLAAEGRVLFANGVYAYPAKPGETYLQKDPKAKIKVGRFFIGALLDGSTSEGGIRTGIDRCQDVRLMLGRKWGVISNVEWTDADEVEKFFNRTLAYGIYGTNSAKYGGNGDYVEGKNEGIPYVNNKDGYYRYKALTDWFLTNNNLLTAAGWQPETDATVTGGNVILERFGASTGNEIYFTVFNDSDQKVDATVTFDFKTLEVTSANFDEIARKTKVDADSNQAKLALEPHKTSIIRLTKTWYQD